MLLLMGLPALLLYTNAHGRTKRFLPILSAAVHVVYVAVMAFQLFAPGIPKYLVYSSLGILDTTFVLSLSYLTRGAVFNLLGCVSALTGSLLSLRKEDT